MSYNPHGLVVVVPDVHGRTFWKDNLINEKPTCPIIFLGDYSDPYTEEGISDEDCYNNFLDILYFQAQYPNDVTLLIGNHELHYFDQNMECTRFSKKYYTKYKTLLEDGLDKNRLQLCKQINKYLFIHAGILNQWYQLHKENFLKLGNTLEEQLNNYFKIDKYAFFQISYLRRGYHRHGSPIWADIREFMNEESPFDENIIQIVGHTQLTVGEPTFFKNVCVTDTRKTHILNLKTEKFI